MINIIATTGRNRPLAVSKASSRFFISLFLRLIPCEDIILMLLGVALGPFDYKAVPIPHLTYAARANASSLAFIKFVAFNGSSYTDSPHAFSCLSNLKRPRMFYWWRRPDLHRRPNFLLHASTN